MGWDDASAQRFRRFPKICAEDLTVGGDPLGIALRQARSISPAAARRWLAGGDAHVRNEQNIPLLPHQVVALRRVRSIIDRWNGALLTDAPGTGKTHIALGLASQSPKTTCAVVPAALRNQWRTLGQRHCVAIDVVSHEQLSRRRPPTSDAALVVVDEAHHFVNPATNRYDELARWIIGRHVLLITATPVVNHGRDVISLLRLFLPDRALALLGVTSLDTLEHDADARAAVFAELAVGRGETEIGRTHGLPTRVAMPTSAAAPLPKDQLERTLTALDTMGQSVGDHPRALLRLHFLRHLCSSRAALHRALHRHRVFLDRAIEARRQGLRIDPRVFRSLVRTASGNEDQLLMLPLLLDPTQEQWHDVSALEGDRETCRMAMAASVGTRDPKRTELQRRLDGLESKVLVFVNSVATAKYLLGTLRRHGAVAVTGAGAWSGAGRISVEDALCPFRPSAGTARRMDAHVLIATDVAGEGLNLQAGRVVIHYDLPWSPVRLEQRVGRVRRIGSPYETVFELLFTPPPAIEQRIRLIERLIEKTKLIASVSPNSSSAVAPRAGLPNRAAEPMRSIGLVYRLNWNGYSVARSLDRNLSREEVLIQLRSAIRSAVSPAKTPEPTLRRARQYLLRAARLAARERLPEQLHALDAGLSRLSLGLTAGETRTLADALRGPRKLERVVRWLEALPPRDIHPLQVELRTVTTDSDVTDTLSPLDAIHKHVSVVDHQ